ncbi:DNA repair protein RadA [Candidatus Roizmanbacteria bacterium CG22_combo_CG10-13_8_21_14_all_38_20]|uniref:DNA repair protein RadA n=1 Tax=Candidatus Roizmanbacteria bacterium CG22_combo_CG10-13_8_21_14_all_38_20 TaxID=1974862 RepID=A0A2H0BW38_9BACT|nr:DNA repair protein RadA [Candidatus Microgenomates bacterium]PIP61260.1 MAG: DNA repair protein RadA [Candidatus Roizmanbacteria bacterium CG22_combo_CG10-13_8_21_14_all_38_20]PJC31736.1 MAG: DNA repair protein RadA [Candidatus Roizmanbacteria bacterium CG_4_9_14_0_2_um_filter_38_17]
MVKATTLFVCQQCGNEFPKWNGQCPACHEWETLVEVSTKDIRKTKSSHRSSTTSPISLSNTVNKDIVRVSTGLLELDRVLGGGLVGGHVVLLAGEPGIGKSTILLQVADKAGCLYVCGEESPEQIKIRADRLNIKGASIELFPETNIEEILTTISKNPDTNLVIVDSVQTLWSDGLTGVPGSIGQVRYCSQKLIELAKRLSIPVILVGQVTKEGTVAGPKVLEHAVDTVLYLEGERLEELRLLRSFKNRFGTVDELAVFKMGEDGMEEIADASKMFLDDELISAPGAVLCPIIAGARVLLVEIQCLVVDSKIPNPKRVSQGFSRSRLEMIAAILQKHLRIPLYQYDIFINVSGGLKIEDPGADLAVALAVYSSVKNKTLANNSCALGELTLLAGVRPVLQENKRLKEAKRLGMTAVYSNNTSKYLPELIKKVFK